MTNSRFKIKLIALGVSLIVLVGLGVWFFFGGTYGKLRQNMSETAEYVILSAGITPKEFFLYGRSRTSNDEILALLEPAHDKTFFSLSLPDLKKQIEELPWVKSCTLYRKLPDTLFIYLVEREPIALWQTENGYFPIDKDGYAIDSKDISFSYLPLIVGEDAPVKYYELSQILAEEPLIQQRMKGAVFSGKRRWTLFLDDLKNGLVIHLPETDVKEAVLKLARLDRENHLLRKNVDVIDLRVQGKLIVRPKANPPKERRL